MSEPETAASEPAEPKHPEPLVDSSGLLFKLADHHSQSIFKTHAEQLAARMAEIDALAPELSGDNAAEAFGAYVGDVMQRSVLFLDLLRERGNSFVQREKDGFKPVLAFDYDIVVDGRKLGKPVNYAVVRIKPPKGFPPQREDARPFVIIDPRAGHGAGIGGSKIDSEVGVALRDGHPVYFVIFFTHPEPGQTLGDVRDAEAVFIAEIRQRHPVHAPLVVGNCQGGWATMLLAAKHPELMGPIVIAGAPLSYWAGEVGKNPLRYLGGLAGGAVPALLSCDLGHGKFDGAGLINNFEQLNPAKTMFRKYYDVFADPERKGGEFIEFEEWWSGFYFMTEAEIRWIVENLFIGNKLTRGEAVLDGEIVDLTKITSPVIVFASHGDNITPPQQALNWIADLHSSVEEIRARGHVIIYTLHDSIGHLGIFVSAKVAAKQHREITSVIKTIEALSPGLYEMMISGQDGDFEVSFEARSIDDLLSHDDGREDEEKFAAAAKVSEWATKTYELTVRPALRPFVTPQTAQTLAAINPIRQRRYLFSDSNPYMDGIAGLAAEVRQNRLAAGEENPFVRLERLQAGLFEQSINFWRDTRDAVMELTFHSIYGSPWMKAIAAQDAAHGPTHDVHAFPEVQKAVNRVAEGGYPEAIVRMLVLLAHARGSISRDRLERTTRILFTRPPFDTMPSAKRVEMLKQQTVIVDFAPDAALQTLTKLLHDEVDRIRAVNVVFDIAGVKAEMDPDTIAMFKSIQRVLMTLPRDWREPPDVSAAPPHTPANSDAGNTPPLGPTPGEMPT
jgi:pimeloyl-ACP methyl ester carboxylesterase